MTTIFTSHDGRDQLFVTGRHAKPVTDELMVTVQHVYRQQSVVLSRADVHRLHAALGVWLTNGWPDVPRRDETRP